VARPSEEPTYDHPDHTCSIGKPYEEKKMIGFAYAYEQASKMRKPSPLVPPLKGETINYATK
jgi:amidase